jgi:hypothetical protein
MMIGLDGKAAGLFSQFNYIQNKALLNDEQTALKQVPIKKKNLNTLIDVNESKSKIDN